MRRVVRLCEVALVTAVALMDGFDWVAGTQEFPPFATDAIRELHKSWIFDHVGKAGGTTVHVRLVAHQFDSAFKTCHPNSCLNKKRVEAFDGMLINVRDPVDRFKSAFDWRHAKACDPSNLFNEAALGGAKCKDNSVEELKQNHVEAWILHKYGNANELAESLCVRGEEAGAIAAADLARIAHARTPLIQHLGGADLFTELSNEILHRGNEARFSIVVVPLEPSFNFHMLVDSAILYIARLYGNMSFAIQAAVAARSFDAFDRGRTETKQRHSSLKTKIPPSNLSAAGACCVANYYREDYQVLPVLAEVGCRGKMAESCSKALQKMVRRRREYLIDGAKTCRALLGERKGGNRSNVTILP